jgi:VanZ family protein
MSPRGARLGLLGRWILVLVYVAVIFVLSAQPNMASPFHFRNGDKVAHTLEYGGLGILLVMAVRGREGWDRPLAGGVLALAMGLGVALVDERFQSIIPGRDCSLFDWLADAGGLILGQLAYLAMRRE